MDASFFWDHRPLWAVLVSLGAAPLILATGDRPNRREAWTFLAAILKLAIVASMLPDVLAGDLPETTPLELATGLTLHLKVDALGLVFGLVASTLWLVTSFFSVGYMRGGHETHQTPYFASFAVCVSSALGIAFSANLITFFIFYELLTLATYPLVVHARTEEAIASGRKYLAYTLIAGQALLVAIVWMNTLAPGAEFTPGGYLAGLTSPAATVVLFVLVVGGIGVKAGLMPVHAWLPAAMVAPTPVSALLHAVAVVKAGAFAAIRILGWVFGFEVLREHGLDVALAVLASITIVFGSLRAMGEDELKRRLAYSTVSQLSYILLGAALGSVAAVAGAIFHIAAHGFMKITLFFCAGAIYVKTHHKHISQLSGLGRKMPITFGAFAVGSMGLAGLPGIAGFVSKWNLGVGSLQADHAIFLAVLLTSGLLNFAYFFPVLQTAFLDPLPEGVEPGVDEAAPLLWVPLAVTAVGAIVLGLFPDAFAHFYELAWTAARAATGGAP